MKKLMLRYRPLRRFYHFFERLIPFLTISLSDQGLGSREGQQLIWGKFRRVVLSFFPPLARALQAHYGMQGGCQHCSSSCKLLFQCPHWESTQGRCSVYEDRPQICRLFPITPADIRDRNLVTEEKSCGFLFTKNLEQKKIIGEEKFTLKLKPALAKFIKFKSDRE